ncbi:MAG: Asp-tRNA(Asn)/Glu-tRNA(Gln) amidotransferase subunit GatA [Lachnospiraceae bacterium]|nr:Asp-tRNA(Asn)/Glu-tRNA(Gln) amidotransferase subunit GatA [Lachnospiraceae bacterium]
MELSKMTALEIGSKIKAKELGVVEVTKAALENIEKTDKAYRAFVTVCGEKALTQAEKIQKGIDDGTLTSPLAGVPMAVKDNMCTEGVLTTCASKILTGFKPTYSSTAVRKLEDAGAVILGKLNMDEFAMGSTTETSVHGVTVNPWGENRAPGGSSGGSAVAVAADEAYYTLGSDTGGSIRQPAAFCGVTGLKPTYGTVSRYGLIAYASSLDQIGPIGKNVEDIAEVLSVISGHDPKDSTSVKQDSIKITLDNNIKGKRIGLPKDYFGEGLNSEVKASVLAAAKKLEELGAIVEEFEMPELQYAIPAYYIIACAEASSNLSRFDGVKYGYASPEFKDLTDLYYKSRSEGFGMEVKRRIMIGAFVLSSGYYDAYYKKALQVKAIIKQSFDRAFEKYDCILSPTAPTTALKIGENLSDPLKMYLGDIYTVSVNLAGLPSMVVPCGFDSQGLPIGLQLTGKAFSENEIMNVGYAFQQSTDYHTKKPVLKTGKEA